MESAIVPLTCSPDSSPLGNHGIDACLCRRPGFLDGAHLYEDLRATAVGGFDIRSRVAPKQHQERHLGLETGRDLLIRGPRQNDVGAEGLVRQCACPLNLLMNERRGSPGQAEHPAGPGVRDRSRELRTSQGAHPDGKDRIRDPKLPAEWGREHGVLLIACDSLF